MKRNRSGFTLIELLVTLGIFIVLGGVVFLNLANRRTNTDLTDTSTEVVATLREAQSDSVAQKNNVSWGVHFSNNTSSPFYALFYTSYSTSTTVGYYPLPDDIAFSTSSIALGSSLDITFNQITGTPSTPTSITLELISAPTTVTVGSSTSITLISSGKIFFDNFNRSSL